MDLAYLHLYRHVQWSRTIAYRFCPLSFLCKRPLVFQTIPATYLLSSVVLRETVSRSRNLSVKYNINLI